MPTTETFGVPVTFSVPRINKLVALNACKWMRLQRKMWDKLWCVVCVCAPYAWDILSLRMKLHIIAVHLGNLLLVLLPSLHFQRCSLLCNLTALLFPHLHRRMMVASTLPGYVFFVVKFRFPCLLPSFKFISKFPWSGIFPTVRYVTANSSDTKRLPCLAYSFV